MCIGVFSQARFAARSSDMSTLLMPLIQSPDSRSDTMREYMNILRKEELTMILNQLGRDTRKNPLIASEEEFRLLSGTRRHSTVIEHWSS